MPEEGERSGSREDSRGGAGAPEPGGARAADHRSAVRRMAWGTVLAVAATAAMIAVTVPLGASGDSGDTGGGDGGGTSASLKDAARREGPPAKVEDAPSATGSGTGRDPLTEEERARAQKVALTGDPGLRAASENVKGDKGAPQHLATDLSEEGGSGGKGREAEVYFYDYADDALVHKTVDLGAGKVAASETAHGAQPPPAWSESHEAAALLLADPLGAGLREDFRRATGKKLTTADQLGVQGLAYAPREARGDALGACGKQRCVRLFTRVAGGGPWIDTQQFVINLSDRSVRRLTAAAQ